MNSIFAARARNAVRFRTLRNNVYINRLIVPENVKIQKLFCARTFFETRIVHLFKQTDN